MSLSYTGWTPSFFRGALASHPVLGGNPSVLGQPAAAPTTPTPTPTTPPATTPPPPAATAASLQTNGTPNDPRLASRQWANPNVGNRQVVAAQSVYGNSNVPAYLSDAVNSLNQEQIQKQNALTGFQNNILQRLDSAQSAADGTDPYSLAHQSNRLSIAGDPASFDYINHQANAWNNESSLYNILAASAVQPGSKYSSGWI